ncbi:Hsp20/alpha crystallin family protein [bacterium]|nr:Hsp20/alpha crystallin family protein [bacterium]
MDKKQFLILLSTLSAVFFIGAFFGTGAFINNMFNTHSDRVFKSAFSSDDAFTDVDKAIKAQQEEMENFHKQFFNTPNHNMKNSGFVFFSNNDFSNSSTIKSEETKDMYKVTVNLKQFNNDSKNVKVNVNKNRVTISANAKDKNNTSSVYQSFSLPSKIDLKSVKQEQEGSNLVITIPKITKK